MKLIFIYGHPASGKLTVAKDLAARTGMALFHNHLIVDAVGSVFRFGSDEFVRLRETFWLEVIRTAAALDRSLIFTFAPEPTVAPDFPARVEEAVAAAGGEVVYVALTVSDEEQERRLVNPDRSRFGKLRSLDLWRKVRPAFSDCLEAMPPPRLRLDTGLLSAERAAERIAAALSA
jgi:tRNA A37 N6-isopentenylltransferase MiaA